MRKYIFVGLALIFGGAAYLVLSNRLPVRPTDSSDSSNSESSSELKRTAPLIIGNQNARLTLVEHGDFQCPRCNRFFHEIEPQIRRDFVDKGLVKIEWRNFASIGEESLDAARAAHCANEQKFFPNFYAEVFTYMNANYWARGLNGENAGALSRSRLKLLAANAYELINQQQFDDCLDSGKYAEVVTAELEAAQKAGYSLNTYLVGREVIQGVQPYAIFKPVIQSQL